MKKTVLLLCTAGMTTAMLLSGCGTAGGGMTGVGDLTEITTISVTGESVREPSEADPASRDVSEVRHIDISIDDCGYMTDYEGDIDPDNLPDNFTFSDPSDFADEDIAELAAEYAGNGYTIQDVEVGAVWQSTLGTDDAYFNTGFFAVKQEDGLCEDAYVVKMTEQQFESIVVPQWANVNGDRSDDGNIIRIGDDTQYLSYDRSTDVCIVYWQFDIMV